MYRFVGLLMILVFVPMFALAQLSPAGGPIQIDADRLDVFERDNRAIYVGNVDALQADAQLTADKLTINFKAREGGREEGISSGFTSPETMIAEGSVTYKTPDLEAKGDTGVYDAAEDTVFMTGNIELNRQGDTANGNCLTIQISEGRSTLGCPNANSDRIDSVFNLGNNPN